jgi:hypothetical protein
MVHKPLPPLLIARLRRAEKKISPRLGGMKNADPNSDFYGKKPMKPHQRNTGHSHQRLRQMDISRNYPGVELVLKRPHGNTSGNWISAQEVITEMGRSVKSFNERFKPKHFELMPPIAYAVGPDLIAMAKTQNPTLRAVFDGEGKNAIRVQKALLKKGITSQDLYHMTEDLRTEFSSYHLFIFFKKGKIVFIPVVDLY